MSALNAKPLNSNEFSSHLFWDIEADKLDWQEHARFIIGRVLDYGTLADWRVIKTHYGLSQIVVQAMQLRSLTKRSASFVAALAHVPQEQFACYATTPLTTRHWIS
jgi:hypothetical protein